MAIVAGFDVHRAQITFDALDTETGEVQRGRIAADPESVRGRVGRFPGERVEVAVEACTGWLFVCEALREAGAFAHLAETAETRPRRGSKRRAKTDRADARIAAVSLLISSAQCWLPEAWIPPAHVRELPAGSQKCCDTRPPAAVPKRPSGRSRSPRIDRSTITSPATRPWTQIS